MVQRLKRKLLYSRSHRRLVGWGKRIHPPGFEGFSVHEIARFFFLALSTGNLVTRASAIAFKLFLAFFPAVIVLLTLIPYIPIADFQNKLLGLFQEMLPQEVYIFIEGTLHDLLVKKHGALLSVSFLLGIFFASNSIDAILLGFKGSTNLSTWHSPLKQRLLSMGLLIAITILMTIGIPVLTISNSVISMLDDQGYFATRIEVFALFVAKWGISILMVLGSISLLYNAGDPHLTRFRFITPGALLALVLVLVVSQLLTFIFGHITDYNALYGSIGAILAVQLWIYFNMIALLIGYELNASIGKARRHRSATLRPPVPGGPLPELSDILAQPDARAPIHEPCCLLLLALMAGTTNAQRYDPLHPPNTYRNADNPYYWKNRPPFEGYWQQDVHYRIKARLDEKTDAADGEYTLTYWNNSPDTLRWVFFHLYQNAYNAGSYADLDEHGKATDPDGKERGTEVRSLTVDGVELARELDNTILKATLTHPLPPGGKVVFQCDFRTHWAGDVYRRMKLFNAWGFKHFDGVHWYPRISVYDRKMGWDTQQHLGSEFYGDFGTYDVELDMPNDMVVEATGWLQNPQEALPLDLRARLDIANFKDKPWNEKPSVVIPYDSTARRVWRYHAENTHDFAFTADPTYRIGEAEWNGIKCIAMAQEPHASGWQNAAAYCAKVIEAHSTWFGLYAYPKMVVADARDGMEYPMLTLDGGRDPGYRGLFVHEVGHNWFFGMVGNNETYRAMLDEGFTQFLTSWGLEHIDGDTIVDDPPKGGYERKYRKPELARESEVYYGYMRDAVRDDLPPINTHSDEFGHWNGGYGHVYYKTATMLYNLQYVLGDSLFIAAMQHYFDQWKICHPYVEDFRNSIIQFTHVDLNWFFDQWIETDKRIDYKLMSVRHRHKDAGQVIHLRRVGSLQMPIDLRVTARDGRHYDYHIPNTWFQKKTTATVLPRWIGWDRLQKDYYAHVDVPTGIAEVRIDTTHRLADAHQYDNSKPPPVESTFDHHLYNTPERRAYEQFQRPEIWWNGYDGLKVGGHFHGDYMRYKHKVWFTAWINTGLGQSLPPGEVDKTRYDPISFNFRYENGTERVLKGSSVYLQARLLDGLELYGGGFNWQLPNGRTSLGVGAKYLLRRDSTDLSYLLYPGEWDLGRLNATVDVTLRHQYRHDGGDGDVSLRLRGPMVGSESLGQSARITALNNTKIIGMQLHTRVIGQYGTVDTAPESALFLAGASPDDMMENKYVRSVGFVPYDWVGAYGAEMGNFQHGGGLNLRGYANYVAPESTEDGQVIVTYRGNTGAALNAELDLDDLVRWRPGALGKTVHLDVYLFGDIGSMGYRVTSDDGATHLQMAPPRADAGAGAAFTIKRWGKLVDLKPLTIRFDMPLFLTNIPSTETEHFAFRYVVGVGRSF